MNFMQISFSGAIVILAILLIRTCSGNQLPKRILLSLWWVALFRLLIPFSFPSTFSVYPLISQISSSALDIALSFPHDSENFSEETSAVFHSLSPGQNETASVSIDTTTAIADSITETGNNMPFVSVWFLIWCAGAIFCTAFYLIAWLRCRFEFQTSLPVNTPFTEQWLKEHPLKRPLSIRQTDKIDTPLTYGVFHPVILLPKKLHLTDSIQILHILSHEYMHIIHFDILMKFISTTALCIHWFNPLVWIMYLFVNRDIELACDESVIFLFGKTSRASYAETLLNMETQKNRITDFYSNFNKNAIEERIIAIMKTNIATKKAKILSCIISVGLLIFATAFFSTSAIAKTDTSSEATNSDMADSYVTASDETASDRFNTASENMVIESVADSDYDPEEILPASKADFSKEGKLLHNYEQFGISYDTEGKFYYDGQPVRYFRDGAEIKEDNEVIGWAVRYEYLNQKGTIDVYTVRETEYKEDGSINTCGPVIGMKQADKKEFHALDIKSLSDPDRIAVAEESVTFDIDSSETSTDTATDKDIENSSTASAETTDSVLAYTSDTSNAEVNGRSLAEIFADYAPYGITYTESVSEDGVIGTVYYNGQPVSRFSDISDETTFSFASDTKGLHVQAIRDKNGKLTGIKPIS